ncbi:STAS domain-containing protein [Streptomyces nitrosporeus]|uniref:Anti-sigma factor antagonist n=1 Tax=Streptomyces nitrosporeus TaxID=28894 RepID=A0A5J6F752_9ACTN|nr:STAS domain-containing protein [Streptomyces nitrosporeus]QEU71763.1 anti-sigma factor antagonist [Streptomyces nitrosporeus]GGY94495.1 hypothetical protein GCM10010327_26420 [Streptomyces nitrosporeus]
MIGNIPPHHDGPGTSSVLAEFERAGCWVVQAQGELDSDTVDPLYLAMWQAAASYGVVVLDATSVTFGDSTFLGLLLQMREETELRVVATSPQLLRLFSLAGLDRMLDCYPDLGAALAGPG